ncbi:hypothetical protein ACFPIJ_42195 [Dactylosporangium cerinum]|uniref:Uncharacterized protein n=1 Tax=Dactylosporangium cerinum TaxID=1434730 RepID=A0ABV9WB26_9ACTN
MTGIDDDWTLDEGRDWMPEGWWRLEGRIPLTVRSGHSDIPGLPLLAFGPQFSGGVLSVYGPRYLDLGHFTRWDATRNWTTTSEREAYDALRDAHPDTFTTVIGGDGPAEVWLVLRLTRHTDPVTDTLLTVHDRTCPAGAHPWANLTY